MPRRSASSASPRSVRRRRLTQAHLSVATVVFGLVTMAGLAARADPIECAGALGETGRGTIFVDVSEGVCVVSALEDRGQGEMGDVVVWLTGGGWEPYVRGEGRIVKNSIDPGAATSLQACGSAGPTEPSFRGSCRFQPRVAGTEEFYVVWTDAVGDDRRLEMTLTISGSGWGVDAARFCAGEDAC